MTSSHVFYIPLMIIVGIIIGLVLGRRSVLVQQEEERRLAERKAARRKRAADAAPSPADEGNADA